MGAFTILFKCLPFFISTAYGVYYLLAAIFPSWREKGWNHWTVYYGNSNRPTNPNSLLVQLGFVKVRKPDAEGDFSEKTGVILFYVIASLLLIVGVGGILWIAYLSPGG